MPNGLMIPRHKISREGAADCARGGRAPSNTAQVGKYFQQFASVFFICVHLWLTSGIYRFLQQRFFP
ncbi:MAG TPA: hypothetical protein VFM25_13390, partial [Verrucomicrobiae bacterium]|nr:hypothetical protein [Verrucomicrobiae bacterium]